jgi:hypothetical protein
MLRVKDEEDIPEAVLVLENDNNNIELLSNREIEIAIPINDDTYPELLVTNSNCEPYKFCYVIPIGILSIILIVYYCSSLL